MKPEFPPGLSQAEIERLKRKQSELAANGEKAQNGSNKKKKNKKKSDNNSNSKENNATAKNGNSLETLEKRMDSLDIRADLSTAAEDGVEKVSICVDHSNLSLQLSRVD